MMSEGNADDGVPPGLLKPQDFIDLVEPEAAERRGIDAHAARGKEQKTERDADLLARPDFTLVGARTVGLHGFAANALHHLVETARDRRLIKAPVEGFLAVELLDPPDEIALERDDDDRARIADALDIKVLHGGRKGTHRRFRAEHVEVPGLDVDRRGREAHDLEEIMEILVREGLCGIVVLRRIAAARNLEHRVHRRIPPGNHLISVKSSSVVRRDFGRMAFPSLGLR